MSRGLSGREASGLECGEGCPPEGVTPPHYSLGLGKRRSFEFSNKNAGFYAYLLRKTILVLDRIRDR